MNHKNRSLKTSVDKDDFLELPQEEQNFLIYNATTGNEERITILEAKDRSWFHQSKSIIGGVIGAVLFFAGKFIVGK